MSQDRGGTAEGWSIGSGAGLSDVDVYRMKAGHAVFGGRKPTA